MTDEQPKIIVDSDWKTQAQAERQKLASKSDSGSKPDKDAKGPTPSGGAQDVPQADFEELVRMLAMPALMYLGQVADPKTGQAMVAPEVSKVYIDLLGVLEDKTKGNLTEQEQQLISGTANELRMVYVEVVRALDKAYAEGRIGPDGSIAAGGSAPGTGTGSGGVPPLRGPVV